MKTDYELSNGRWTYLVYAEEYPQDYLDISRHMLIERPISWTVERSEEDRTYGKEANINSSFFFA